MVGEPVLESLITDKEMKEWQFLISSWDPEQPKNNKVTISYDKTCKLKIAASFSEVEIKQN